MILNSKYNFLKPFKVKKLLRLGRKFDGGYLVCSDALRQCENLITLGVGDDTSFEIDFDKKKNSKIIQLYDHTVNNILFLKIIAKYFRRLITFRTTINNFTYSISNYINFLKFINKKNVILNKYRVVKKIRNHNDINLEKIFQKINNNKNLLKIDIEGSEYEIIDDIISHSSKIKMLIVEFHWINKKKKLFVKSIKKLKNKFDIIHLHANNYRSLKNNEDIFDVIEITMVNKNTNQFRKQFRVNFPIKKLDYECFPNHKKINFSFKD